MGRLGSTGRAAARAEAVPPLFARTVRRRAEGAPLYHQIKTVIEDQILSGQLRKGQILPPAPELCRTFGVSTITMRPMDEDGVGAAAGSARAVVAGRENAMMAADTTRTL